MEGTPSIEKRAESLSAEKQELLNLEAENAFVFHGSGADLETIEPRQAIDTEAGPDGEPAIFASDKAEYAIFMAIVNKRNCPRGSYTRSGAVISDGVPHLHFDMSKDTAEQLQDSATGWVYVFNKSDFVPHPTKEGVEFVSYKAAAPVRKIRVAKPDLPEHITVFDS